MTLRQRFLEDGFVAIRLSAPPEAYARLRLQLAGHGEDIGHDLVRLPEMPPLLADPVLVDALREILGAEPMRDECCHMHMSGPMPQQWHQDRHCDHPEWPVPMIIACMYLQDTEHEMGPTVVRSLSGIEHTIAGPAGTAAVMRHDLWHRRSAAIDPMVERIMIKTLWRKQ